MGGPGTKFTAEETLWIHSALEENKNFAGKYDNCEAAYSYILESIQQARLQANSPRSGSNLTLDDVKMKLNGLARWAPPRLNFKVKDLIERGPHGCLLVIPPFYSKHQAQGNVDETLLFRSDEAVAGYLETGTALCTDVRPSSRLPSQQGDLHAEAHLAVVYHAAKCILQQDSHIHHIAESKIIKDIRQIQARISAVFRDLQSCVRQERLAFSRASDNAKLLFANLIDAKPGKESEAMSMCQDTLNLSNEHVLAAITGSIILNMFNNFQPERDVACLDEVDRVVGLLGPGCEMFRVKLKARYLSEYLQRFRDNESRLQNWCERYVNAAIDVTWEICRFTPVRNSSEFSSSLAKRDEIRPELMDIFVQAICLRIDLAMSGYQRLVFPTCKATCPFDERIMQADALVATPDMVRLCLMFAVNEGVTGGTVLSKAIVV